MTCARGCACPATTRRQPADVRPDDHVGVLAAKPVAIVAHAGHAVMRDDARGLEPAQVGEDVALASTQLGRQLVHRSRVVGEVERRDDLTSEARDPGEARGHLLAHSLEQLASRQGDGIDGGCGARHGLFSRRYRRVGPKSVTFAKMPKNATPYGLAWTGAPHVFFTGTGLMGYWGSVCGSPSTQPLT